MSHDRPRSRRCRIRPISRRLRAPPTGRAGRRPTRPPDRRAWRGCARGWPRRAWTPTSASGPEHMRYLTGFALDDGEDRVAGNSGRFLVAADEVVVLADSRYRLQAAAAGARGRIEAVDVRPGRPAGPALARGAGGAAGGRRGGLRQPPAVGGSWRPRRRTWSWSRSRAGSRPIGRSRSRPRSSASGPPARSPTAPWRPSCAASGPA